MTNSEKSPHDSLSALKWHVDLDIDEVISETPLNRLAPARKRVEAAPPKVEKAAPVVRPEHPVTVPTPAHENDAEALVQGSKTLEDLEAMIKDFEGCSLKRTAMNTVFSRGDAGSNLMLIGEAPGADEDRQGKPFVGASGQLLDKMMAAIGRHPDKGYYISNILPWRPPGNRKPTPQEVAVCLPFIKRHIELADPEILVLLGGTAVSALLEISDGITRTRGKWYSYPSSKGSIPAMATFHPAYLLRQPQLKRQAWQDLLEIKAKLEG